MSILNEKTLQKSYKRHKHREPHLRQIQSGDIKDEGTFLAPTDITATSPVTWSSTTLVIAMGQAGASASGYLATTDWNTFNGKESALTFSTGLSRAVNTITCTITQYTDALARASISETITGIDYSSSTGVFSITSGYVIPTTTQETNWTTGYTHSTNNNQAHTDYLKNDADDTTSGKLTASGGFVTKVSTADTANPPTNAELITAFGTAATVGAGFTAILNDAGGGTNVYIIISDGTTFFHSLLTKAL